MATGGQADTSAIDVSVTSGSEAVFEHVCQPCRDDEKIREAVGFCVDCVEWLCEECFRIHTRPRPTRNHVLKDLAEMKKSSLPLEAADRCTKKCDQHTGKKIKYYCADHDFLGCSSCVIQGHKTCKVDHIPDVCKSIGIKGEFQQVTAKLGVIAKESKDTASKVNANKEVIQKNKTAAVTACRNYINKLKESLDEKGLALEDTYVKRAEAETQTMTNVSENCEAVEKESLEMKAHLEDLEMSGQLCNAFVALKQSKAGLVMFDSKLKDAKQSSAITTYTFKPNLAVERIIVGSEGIGSLVEQQPKKERDYSNIQAQHVGEISVKMTGNMTCGITGAALLPPNKLVLADFDNKQVKVLDTKTSKLVSDYKVDDRPWTVCKVNDSLTYVAITIYKKYMLLFLSVDETTNISRIKKISVSGECMGVAVMDDKMVITYVDPDKLEIMDTSGIVLQTITDPQIVNGPQYVAVSPDKKLVYVSNYKNGTMTCVNLDGTLVATYRDSQLKSPEQMSIDNNGMIYLGCRVSNNVHLVTPDCKKVKVILDESDGLKNAYAMSYCEQTDRLYIGMDHCDVIKVFQL